MSHVIKAVLHNPSHPEYGQITIPFPIPLDEYDQTIEMLQAIELGFSINRDSMSYVIKATLLGIIPEEPEPVTVCFPIPDEQYDRTIDRLSQARMDHATSTNCTVSKLDSGYSVLAPLKGALVNVDQLDYLAKRLDSFDEGEAAQFQAMACKMSIRSLKDFINLTFCCQQATVIADFNDLEQAGRDHRMNLNGGVLSAEEAKLLDGRKEALQLIQSGAGTITPFRALSLSVPNASSPFTQALAGSPIGATTRSSSVPSGKRYIQRNSGSLERMSTAVSSRRVRAFRSKLPTIYADFAR